MQIQYLIYLKNRIDFKRILFSILLTNICTDYLVRFLFLIRIIFKVTTIESICNKNFIFLPDRMFRLITLFSMGQERAYFVLFI